MSTRRLFDADRREGITWSKREIANGIGCTGDVLQVVRDIGADEKLVDRLLDTSVRFVESRNKTFHCITPDCPGWWFTEAEDANALIHCKVKIPR